MVINKDSITNADTAKKLKYNNRDLTDQEKNIFDQLGTSPSLDKIKDTAELLETVILAKDSSTFNLELYGKLTEGLTKKSDSVKAINTNGNQFQKAVDHQLEKRGTDNTDDKDKPKFTEAEIEARIKTLKIQQAGLDRLYADEQKKIDDNIGQAGTHERNIRKFTERLGKLKEFKDLLEEKDVPNNGTKLLNANATVANIKIAAVANLKTIIDEAKTNLDSDVKFWKTKVRSYYDSGKGGHLYVGKGHLFEFNREVIDCFKKIGDDKMKQVINDKLSGSDKTDALALWKKINKNSIWGIDNFTNDVTSWMYEWRCHRIAFKGNYKDNSLIYKQNEASYPKSIVKITDGTNNTDPLWPYGGLNEKDFFDFMKLVFPRNTYNENSNTFKTNPITKEFDDLDFTIRFFGLADDLTSGLSGNALKKKNFVMKKILDKKYGVEAAKHLKPTVLNNIKLKSVVGFFWDVYNDDTIFNEWDSQPDNVEVSISRFTALELDFVKALRSSTIGISEDDVSDEVINEVIEQSKRFFYTYGSDSVFGNEGSNRKSLYSETRLGGNKNDWRDYIDTVPLETKIIELEDKIDAETIKRDQWKSMRKDWIEKQANYQHQKQDKQHEIDELTTQLGILKTKDVDQLKADFRKDYAGELKDKTRPNINTLIRYLERITDLEKIRQKAAGEPEVGLVDDDLKTAWSLIDALDKKLIPHEGVMQNFETYGKTSKERALNKNLDDVQLRDKYKKAFDAVAALRKLVASEQDNLDAINLKLEGKLKDETPKTSDLNEATLTTLLGFTVDKELKDKWAITLDTIVLTEDNLKTIFLNDYGKTKDKHGALLDHLSKTGDVDAKKYDITDDTKKAAAWEEFIKKGPEKVIKTIVAHEFEEIKDNVEEKKKITDEMAAKTEGDKVLNKSKYGGDNFDDPGIKKYLYEKKIGAKHEFLDKEEQKDEAPETPPKESSLSDWFKFRKDNILKPCVTYIGGTLLIVGIFAFIFWKNITDWWNGPAEEEGQGTTKEDEEKDENE